MHASSILTFGLATLAAAAPTSNSAHKTNKFAVTNFVFGCTSGCYWNFDLAVKGSEVNHPAISTPVHCSGGLDENKDYVDCGGVSATQNLRAYIVKATNELKLEYEVRPYTEPGSVYRYYANTTVYAATGSDAKKQKTDFTVKQSSATAVA